MIICCGEALIDMVPVLSESGQASYLPLVGGAIFNTAIGLGRLGVQVSMLAGVSNDLFGQQLNQALIDSKVDTSYLVRSTAPTTLAFVTLDAGNANYTFYDESSAGRSVEVADLPNLHKLQGNNNAVNTLYFGGISLINEPAAGAYCDLAHKYAADMVIMVDPNIRTNFINHEQNYRQRLESIISVADIIKVSDQDLDWLAGNSHNELQQVDLLRGTGKAIVVVTKGADGATAYLSTGETVHQDVPKVCVVDTVGAGDTFNAGLLAKLATLGLLSKTELQKIKPEKLLQALAYAAQVAGVNVSRQGANPPWLKDMSDE